MITSKSTVKEPLKFFQWIFELNNFERYKSNFLSEYEENTPDAKIDYENGIVRHWGISNEGDEVTMIVRFEHEITKKLFDEFVIFLQMLDESVDSIFLNGNISLEKYFELLQIKIAGLVNSSKPLFKQYPFVENYVLRLSEEIQKKQSMFFNSNSNSEIQKEKINSIDVTINDEEEKKIDNLFSLLLDKGMPDNDWKQLMIYTHSFMRTSRESPIIPEIKAKISVPPKVKKQELYRLFHKLYFDFGERGTLNSYSEFIINTFIGFEKRIIKNLSKKLSTNL